ncbi:MAG: hypothetical protein ACKPE3_39990 [Sphaerospermopsis kisseleviana]
MINRWVVYGVGVVVVVVVVGVVDVVDVVGVVGVVVRLTGSFTKQLSNNF